METENNLGGRPGIFSRETMAEFCNEVATTSLSIRSLCKNDKYPAASTIFKWLGGIGISEDDSNWLVEQYTRAREAKADVLAEEILDIADDGSNDLMTVTKGDLTYDVENKEVVSRSRLRVDARKWLASKLMPKKYGEKLDVTSGGEKLPDTLPPVNIIMGNAPPLAGSETEVDESR